MRIVVDASVLVALLNPHDLWRTQAVALMDALLSAELTPVYFDCVVAEAVSASARRLHEKMRASEVQDLMSSLDSQVPRDMLTWILPDVPRLYSQVLDLVRSSAGELNFNDALIALACQERDILFIASFDADFDRIAWLRRLVGLKDITDIANN
jgi:predicted nucleic acid-binding protein